MDTLFFVIRKLLYGIPMLFGVTLISFVLMVHFGPDKTYTMISKHATEKEIAEVRHQLGYDRPFIVRYKDYVTELVTFDFGYSDSTGEKVSSIFAKSIPISVALALPGFFLGNILGILLALWAAYYRGRWQDRLLMAFSVIGMSISYLTVIIGFQILFCSSFGLNLFPVRGWDVQSVGDYLAFVTVPTMATVFVALGYNTRFNRAIFVEEFSRDHVRTAKAFGYNTWQLLVRNVLRNSLIPIMTRIVFTIPFIIIEGNLIAENYFGIPGIGRVIYEAITTGDLPIIKAAVGWTAILYVFMLILNDILYKVVDPRISLK